MARLLSPIFSCIFALHVGIVRIWLLEIPEVGGLFSDLILVTTPWLMSQNDGDALEKFAGPFFDSGNRIAFF